MALPTETTAFDKYFDALLYTGARLSGTKGLAALGKKVLDARTAVQKSVVARNDANDADVLANVAQDMAWDEMASPLASFERQVTAYFDDDRAGYKAVFPLTVAALLRSNESVRPRAFAPVIAFAKKSGHQGRLAAAARDLVEAWGEYETVSNRQQVTAERLRNAYAALAAAKRQGVVVMREVEGTLRAKFAEEPKLWKRFFSSNAALKKKASQSAQPEPARATGG